MTFPPRFPLAPDAYNPHRREFLSRLSTIGLAVAGAGTACTGRSPRFAGYPFTLGVASGDPSPDGAALWTRLAPDPIGGGGMPPDDVAVEWRVATDDRMRRVVRRGRVTASADLAHSVHAEVTGLEPDRWYWYQFRAGREMSPIGRTRTTPLPTDLSDRLRFAFASCQHYEQGLFTAYDHLSQEELDLVIHLGDYIYESAPRPGRVRLHAGDELITVDDYRNRYAQYKLDAHLQAAHAAFPWVVTTDDHEVDNNYAGLQPEDAQALGAFLRRRIAAYQAFYEHMPLRARSRPTGPGIPLYRAIPFGTLATLFALDTRQYRTDQPCGDRVQAPCDDSRAPHATLLGAAQEQWLLHGLDRSPAQWNVLGQQVLMAHVDRAVGPDERYSMDQWSGYVAARDRLLDFLRVRRPRNPIVLTGDIHSNWVNELPADFTDSESSLVATEFVGTSISSGGDGSAAEDRYATYQRENPFVRYFDGRRGYVRCTVEPTAWRTDYRAVDVVSRPGGAVSTTASFVVRDGDPRVES